jgi:glycosyltransferase involved in cell wall biosynthesis
MKNKKPLVSIIIPIYNAEKYVSKCIESVINQSYEKIEVLLINDGSTDNSQEICDAYAIKDQRVKVIHKQNQGVSSARNLGIDESKGEYISFVDSDDWIDLDTYKRLIACTLTFDVEVVIFEYDVVYEDGKVIFKSYKNLEGVINKTSAIETVISPVSRFAVTKLYKRNIIGDIRFDTSIHIGEDTLFVMRTLGNANSIYYMAYPFYHYWQSDNSATRSKFNKKIFTGIDAYKQLVEKCKAKYPEITDVAISAYINLIINVVMLLYENSAYPDSSGIIKKLNKIIRKNYLTLMFSKKNNFKMKAKFSICFINTRLLYLMK